MPVYTEQTENEASSVDETSVNSNNDSSARKFTTTDSVSNNEAAAPTSNIEYVVNLAAGVRSTAVTAAAAAAVARRRMKTVNDEIDSIDADVDPNDRQPASSFDSGDVSYHTERFIEDVDNESEQGSGFGVGDLLEAVKDQVLPGRDNTTRSSLINSVVPDLESIKIDFDLRKGVIDCFYTKLVFNIPTDKRRELKAFRIFRADWIDPVFTRPLTPISSVGMQRLQKNSGRSKNSDQTSVMQSRLDESDVINAVSQLNPINPFTNLRVSADDVKLTVAQTTPTKNTQTNSDLPDSLASLDSSVANNVNVLSNLQQDPSLRLSPSYQASSVVVGQSVPRDGNESGERPPKGGNGTVVEKNNQTNFSDIALVSVEQLEVKRIGDQNEYVFEDHSVVYGRGYRYFVVSVDNDMRQSTRSNIANVAIECIRVPPFPSSVSWGNDKLSIQFAIAVEDQLVEKFEIYRQEYDADAEKVISAVTISDIRGYTTSIRERTIGQNKYILIGECINPMIGGATYTDRNVIPGKNYIYRIYSVDIFGNKSEAPRGVKMYMPDYSEIVVGLKKPTILVERDAGTEKARITIQCDDESVKNLYLQRRDLTLGHSAFVTPDSPPRLIFGSGPVIRQRNFIGEVLSVRSAGETWSGVFSNTRDAIVFIDQTISLDHIYQYRVYGTDSYGNRTSYALSRPTLMVRRPFIDMPVNLAASVAYSNNGDVVGVNLSWDESNTQASAEELIGSQDALTDSRIRTLYQIERKKSEEEVWEKFSLVTGSTFFDQINTKENPSNRPPFVELNRNYEYRLQAVQTGAFISNFTSPVSVFVGYQLAAPENFQLKIPSYATRPFYVMLNWDTPVNSGIVDRWEIQRAAVNNVAASKLNLKDPASFANLHYREFRTVYRESSRVLGKEQDDLISATGSMTPGQHFYPDSMIDFGNSYFYRIRAVSPSGLISPWSYRGAKITSLPWEKKWLNQLSEEEINSLAESMEPLEIANYTERQQDNSMSVQPSYSRPVSNRISAKVDTSLSMIEEA